MGINTAILSRSGGNQGIGFAIPINMARPILKILQKSGTVHRARLGIMIQTLTPGLAKALGQGHRRGVLVSSVLPNSPPPRPA